MNNGVKMKINLKKAKAAMKLKERNKSVASRKPSAMAYRKKSEERSETAKLIVTESQPKA
jgi:hypothetical protein